MLASSPFGPKLYIPLQESANITGPHWGWNWDFDTRKPKNATITISDNMHCKNCFAKAETGVELNLLISNYELQDVSIYVTGTADFHIHAVLRASLEAAAEKELTTIAHGPFTFAVGKLSSSPFIEK